MNKLHRSKSNTMIAGICGGLGEYLGVDPTLVRLVFVLLTVISGVGLLLYLVLLILMPQAGSDLSAAGKTAPLTVATGSEGAVQPPAPPAEGKTPDSRNATLFFGIALIVFGAAYLLRNLDIRWFRWFSWHTFWPLVLIAIGLAVLVRPAKGE